MQNPLIEEVKSITTSEKQKMVLDGRDAEIIKNKKVLLIDDTFSTGNSFRAMIGLLKNLNVKITNMATVLREGDFDISDIEKQTNLRFLFLENLPLFVK